MPSVVHDFSTSSFFQVAFSTDRLSFVRSSWILMPVPSTFFFLSFIHLILFILDVNLATMHLSASFRVFGPSLWAISMSLCCR